ncbi:hypothetical protein F5H01DRAFT_174268 [Linnemannia elongata]|nr:hypothetical protein F5H01DRAFT_174268 [Linnemannia elongata]
MSTSSPIPNPPTTPSSTMSSSTMSTPFVSSSSATGTASSASASATATDSIGNSTRNGNNYASCAGIDCSNGGYGLGPLSLKSVFYFIGFLGLVIALFYTIFVVRRRRRHNNRPRDPEMAEHRGARATYRPDSGDEGMLLFFFLFYLFVSCLKRVLFVYPLSPSILVDIILHGYCEHTRTAPCSDVTQSNTEKLNVSPVQGKMTNPPPSLFFIFRCDSIVSPPQYRAYMLDQPYTDPESVIVYPDSVHYGTEQGIIQHLAVLQQQERSQRTTTAASSTDQDSTNDDNLERPMLTTTMTTTTTTTTTTTVVSPRSSTAATASGTIEGGEAETTTSTTITEPAPAHAQTFFTGRHLSILRMGLSNYSHNHSRSSRPNNSRSSSSSSNSSSGSRSTTQQRPVRQMWTNPAQYTESYLIIHPTNTTFNSANSNGTSGSNGTGSSLPPTLSRLRSMGPPPYIPTSDDEEAPALPPSYNVVVETSSASSASSTTEIAAH